MVLGKNSFAGKTTKGDKSTPMGMTQSEETPDEYVKDMKAVQTDAQADLEVPTKAASVKNMSPNSVGTKSAGKGK